MSARTDYCISGGSEPPSDRPSVSPTNHPTTSPYPTLFPTKSAAPSTSPTIAPTPTVVAVGPFQLKLHWTRKSCWTGSGNEVPNCREEVTRWCMQCEGHRCNEGDILWVEPCRDDAPDTQLFQWLPLPSACRFQRGTPWSRPLPCRKPVPPRLFRRSRP